LIKGNVTCFNRKVIIRTTIRVDLSAFAGSGDLTLMTIETGTQGAFASVMVDGEDQAANVSYTGGDGNDVVLTVVASSGTAGTVVYVQ
jgi:hypothetical protein